MANAGQNGGDCLNTLGQPMEKGKALDPIGTYKNTAADYTSQHTGTQGQPPAWQVTISPFPSDPPALRSCILSLSHILILPQVATGVAWNRFRTCNTPHRSVRWRRTKADMAADAHTNQIASKHSMKEELAWIADGESRFKIDPVESSSIPKSIRQQNDTLLQQKR